MAVRITIIMDVRKWVLGLAALAACGSPASTSGALRVVATTAVLADFVKEVGGTRVTLSTIMKAGVDAHDFEPSPADLEAIRGADLILKNGAGLEAWIDSTIASARPRAPVIDASEGVVITNKNPHIWLDPRRARIMVTNVARALERVDPEGRPTYVANLDAYVARLDTLDASIAARIAALKDKKIVTNHDAFGYYIERYGLEFIGSILPSFDTSVELSSREVQELVAHIKAASVRAIFSEAQIPAHTAETVAREAGVRVVSGDSALYGDGLGPPGSPASTYIDMMNHNTEAIVAGLS